MCVAVWDSCCIFCCKPGKGPSDLYLLLLGFLRSVSFIVFLLCFWLFKSLDIIFQVSLTRSLDMIVALVIMDLWLIDLVIHLGWNLDRSIDNDLCFQSNFRSIFCCCLDFNGLMVDCLLRKGV
jgi:hypothetical protein